MMKRPAVLLAVVAVSFGLPACGGGDSSTTDAAAPAASPTTTASETANASESSGLPMATTADGTELPLMDNQAANPHVRYAADPDRKFSYYIAEASTRAGTATIQFVNPQKTLHNVAIEGHNGELLGETKPVSEGIAQTKIVVKPGVYVVYCSLPGHRKAGMTGHLTVYPK